MALISQEPVRPLLFPTFEIYTTSNILTDTAKAPTIALDKNLNGTTFAVIMFDPDTPATGVGGNGTNSFMHWFQDGFTSSSTSVSVAGKTVFPLVNAKNVTAVQSYVYVVPSFSSY
jgi:hypothetical protein